MVRPRVNASGSVSVDAPALLPRRSLPVVGSRRGSRQRAESGQGTDTERCRSLRSPWGQIRLISPLGHGICGRGRALLFAGLLGKADGASGSETKEVGTTVPGVAVALVLSVAWTWVAWPLQD